MCFFVSSVFISSQQVHANETPQTLTFEHKQQKITLTHKNTGYLTDSLGYQYAYNEKILVRSALSSDSVKVLHPHIKKIQTIAKLPQSTIYWITPTPLQFFKVYLSLQANHNIKAIEPDLAPIKRLHKNSALSKQAYLMASPKVCDNPIHPVRVAIIDDGFTFSHDEFSHANVLLEYDPDQQKIDASSIQLTDYHGTLVSGIIAAKQDNAGVEGYASNSELIAIKQVSTWSSSLIIAFHVAKLMKADIVNCSWTMPFVSDLTALMIESLASAPNNPIIVVAAGNRGALACEDNRMTQINSVTVVGAMDTSGNVASFSNHGECVDVYAPYGVMSTAVQGYALFGGTSSSAAIVSGLLANGKSCDANVTLETLMNNKKYNVLPRKSVER